MIEFLQNGPGGMLADFAWTGARIGTGVFFATSGMHKAFWPSRRASLKATLRDDGVPVGLWPVVAAVEFIGGIALAMGLFTATSAALLLGIIVVALCCECVERVRAYEPLDAADWLCDLLYLPETLLGIMLALFASAGGGAYALDALF